ncbi:DNA recombination protein RmuC [Patescibacteria group bacterium]|nr:DNA recombination protein RmuC [Patescibacteria group bacterium]
MADFLFILIIFLIVAGGAGILIYFLLKVSGGLGQQSQINLQQAQDIQEIKEKLLLGTQLQDHLKNGIEKTKDLLEDLKRADQVRQQKEAEFSERIKRVDEIIAGTSTKGISGEEILRETFKKLPPEMIESNFTVRGKTVEFALILPNNKRLPIDSKWPAGSLILELEKESSPKKRKEIIGEIEKETVKRIKEVKQYIDPSVTWSQAIAAVPDSVYGVCREAHLKARENDVILMPYSMVLPLLLYMYRLHLQYAMSIDMENLQNHLISISRNLDEMENILENKIARATTMVSNAYSDYKQMISKIRASLNELQIRQPKEKKKLKESNKV